MFVLPTTEITTASVPYSSLSIRICFIIKYKNFSFCQRQSPAVSTTASRNIYILKKSALLDLNNSVSKHKCPSITYTLLCFKRRKVYVCESNSRMQEPLLLIAYYIKMFHWHWAVHQRKRLLHVHSWHYADWHGVGFITRYCILNNHV